jgi:hypothetical protein
VKASALAETQETTAASRNTRRPKPDFQPGLDLVWKTAEHNANKSK